LNLISSLIDFEHIHSKTLAEFYLNKEVWEVVAQEKIEVSLSIE
jgi:hypothetical protein